MSSLSWQNAHTQLRASVKGSNYSLTPVKPFIKCTLSKRLLTASFFSQLKSRRQLPPATATVVLEPVVATVPDEPAPAAPSPAPAPAPPSPSLWQRNWVPVCPVADLDPGRPTPLTLLGKSLVVWHHATQGWVVMADACPHRLAPLSEGRLEAGGTRLACAYHGWEFNQAGDCTRIPQLAHDQRAASTACGSRRSCVSSFPTSVKDGLLFAWLDGSREGLQAAKEAPEPSLLDERATKLINWGMQEVPNDFSFWIEQGMDPSHANFLHHGLGGFKDSNFVPMAAQVVSGVDPVGGYQWRHGAYEKKQAGMKAHREFSPPYTTRFRYDMPNGTSQYYCTLVVPVRPGVSRTFFVFGTGPAPETPEPAPASAPGATSAAAGAAVAAAASDGEAKAKASSNGSDGDSASASKSGGSSGKTGGGRRGVPPFLLKLVGSIPHWVFFNRLLSDQDIVMMCRQEQLMRRQGLTARDYNLNSPADAGVAAVNTWLRKVDYPASLWGSQPAAAFPGQTYAGWPAQELPLERILSRQERHVKHCAVCQEGMRLVTRACVAATAAAVLAGAAAAALAVLAVLGPQTAGAAAPVVGVWRWVGALAAAAAGLAVLAVKGWDFREERFGSGLRQWQQRGGFPGFKKMA